jgi:hypothetical protein
MAKKDKKKDMKDDTVAALRAAVERTLQISAEGAQSTRDRTREIVDEIAAAAGRVRSTLEDLRVLDEIKGLRREVETLARRVASLEKPATGSGDGAAAAPAATAAATKPRAAKPRAAKPRAGKPRAATPSAAKPGASARKPAGARKPRATKPTTAAEPTTPTKPTTPAKPAGPGEGS